MGVGQPGMQRRQPDLGAVADQQEDESEVQQRRVELRRLRRQHRPRHRIEPLAHHRRRREIDEDRAEQGERDADAAEDEILPRRLERLGRAVDADHQHGRERRDLDRHPHQADVVGDQRQVHAEHQQLVHRVIEAQISRRQPADLQLVVDVAGAEGAGRQGDEGRQHDEDDVEVVDQQERPGCRPRVEQESAASEGERAGARH